MSASRFEVLLKHYDVVTIEADEAMIERGALVLTKDGDIVSQVAPDTWIYYVRYSNADVLP